MQPELITRVVGLVGKNGERVVLVDPQSGRAVVVLDLDAYEALSGGAKAPVVTASGATAPAAAFKVANEQKFAQQSEKTSKEKKPILTAKPPKETSMLSDLTQEELIAKINRDIGAWKTAKETNTHSLSDEERFYLEPIE